MTKKIAIMMILIFSMNTISCTKPAKVSMPVDQIKFDDKYRYAIKLNTNKWIGGIDGSKISATLTELNYELRSQKSSLLNQDVSQINGFNKKDSTTGMVAGIGIGVAGVIAGSLFAAANKPDQPAFGQQEESNFAIPLIIGMLAGAVIGGIVQSAIANRSAVEITPTIIPVSNVTPPTENESTKPQL